MRISYVSRSVLMIVVLFACAEVDAHTATETNALIRSMLRPLLVRTNIRNGRFVSRPRAIRTQAEFFAADDSWSSVQKRGAFDWYLENFSTSDLVSSFETANPLARAAIIQCDVLGYTNALPVLKENVFRDSAKDCRVQEVELIVKWSAVSDETTQFIGAIITNRVEFDSKVRNAAAFRYADKVKASVETPMPVKMDVVAVFYANRHDWACSVPTDKLLVRCIPGYETSSNRLDYALQMVDDTNSVHFTFPYFSSITNQLLNAAQPLSEVEALRGL